MEVLHVLSKHLSKLAENLFVPGVILQVNLGLDLLWTQIHTHLIWEVGVAGKQKYCTVITKDLYKLGYVHRGLFLSFFQDSVKIVKIFIYNN